MACILVVDDSAAVRDAIRKYIESETQHTVCEAGSGIESVQKARDCPPDLVVLDLLMPNMGGMEAASALRAMLPRTPIVMFTIEDASVSRTLAARFGITHVVSKWDGDGLVRCISSLLGVSHDSANPVNQAPRKPFKKPPAND